MSFTPRWHGRKSYYDVLEKRRMSEAKTYDSFEELLEHCKQKAHLIFVREEVDGKWGRHSLKELGDEKILEWAKRWWDERLQVV